MLFFALLSFRLQVEFTNNFPPLPAWPPKPIRKRRKRGSTVEKSVIPVKPLSNISPAKPLSNISATQKTTQPCAATSVSVMTSSPPSNASTSITPHPTVIIIPKSTSKPAEDVKLVSAPETAPVQNEQANSSLPSTLSPTPLDAMESTLDIHKDATTAIPPRTDTSSPLKDLPASSSLTDSVPSSSQVTSQPSETSNDIMASLSKSVPPAEPLSSIVNTHGTTEPTNSGPICAQAQSSLLIIGNIEQNPGPGRKCCVRGCPNIQGIKGVYRQFFLFPNDEKKRNVWVANMPQSQEEGWTPAKSSTICQDHFVAGG